MIMPLDAKIVRWLSEGEFYQALLGKGDYLVYDYYYRGRHNKLLVVSTMVAYAVEYGRFNYVKVKFSEALQRICIEDQIAALEVIHAYILVVNDKNTDAAAVQIAINVEEFYDALCRSLRQRKGLKLKEQETIISLSQAIGRYVSMFTRLASDCIQDENERVE